ncbi:hypothetical protein GOBAR_AA21579 [Gossypium barbadense]|uniref:Uncharacterized protein n=1 Tax=Gossypium barbadense TaxID=3634 RepID=A0A2P5X6X9_GOSBA|nr:hypothetical protein GOBAR_AA21579 [Gossypium barbadense]
MRSKWRWIEQSRLPTLWPQHGERVVKLDGLPSNTESNPREKINANTIQDEEGLVAPKPEQRQETVEISSKNLHKPCLSNNKGPTYEERRLKIEELDEWKTQKLRTPDKPKPSQDELNISTNQLKVGDKVLLDAADPHITTSEPNEEIPLTVLSIFPYGTVELIAGMRSVNSSSHHDHTPERVSPSTWPGTRVCLRSCTHYRRRHGRAISRHGRVIRPWAKLQNQHRRTTRPCCETVGVPVKLALAFDTPVPSLRGRHCQTNTGVGYHTRA